MKGAFPMFCIAQNKEALVTDNMNWHDGDLNWDAMFIKLLKNWEVGSLQLFLDILYSSKVNQGRRTDWFGPMLGEVYLQYRLIIVSLMRVLPCIFHGKESVRLRFFLK